MQSPQNKGVSGAGGVSGVSDVRPNISFNSFHRSGTGGTICNARQILICPEMK
jgi:hypothetical protein